ncbi:MAG TPA: sulfatase, partial [Flavobacterium sp.]|nr:sulfatase [Flavobacterium sp.]
DSELNSIFNPVIETNPTAKPTQQNVVVIILESFGSENIQRGQTPFLDSLIRKSLFFENGFANGKLSIDAVPSTLSSIPSLMSSSLITSSYSINKIYGLPKILKGFGYHTAFFHGAFNGSQNFDQYCKVAGFDAYYGKNEYKGPEAFDGKWGIFDEEFFQFYCQKMSQFKQPFFTSIFSISSHNPYKIPERYKG